MKPCFNAIREQGERLECSSWCMRNRKNTRKSMRSDNRSSMPPWLPKSTCTTCTVCVRVLCTCTRTRRPSRPNVSACVRTCMLGSRRSVGRGAHMRTVRRAARRSALGAQRSVQRGAEPGALYARRSVWRAARGAQRAACDVRRLVCGVRRARRLRTRCAACGAVCGARRSARRSAQRLARDAALGARLDIYAHCARLARGGMRRSKGEPLHMHVTCFVRYLSRARARALAGW